jgi:hypothetical protein
MPTAEDFTLELYRMILGSDEDRKRVCGNQRGRVTQARGRLSWNESPNGHVL